MRNQYFNALARISGISLCAGIVASCSDNKKNKSDDITYYDKLKKFIDSNLSKVSNLGLKKEIGFITTYIEYFKSNELVTMKSECLQEINKLHNESGDDKKKRHDYLLEECSICSSLNSICNSQITDDAEFLKFLTEDFRIQTSRNTFYLRDIPGLDSFSDLFSYVSEDDLSEQDKKICYSAIRLAICALCELLTKDYCKPIIDTACKTFNMEKPTDAEVAAYIQKLTSLREGE